MSSFKILVAGEAHIAYVPDIEKALLAVAGLALIGVVVMYV